MLFIPHSSFPKSRWWIQVHTKFWSSLKSEMTLQMCKFQESALIKCSDLLCWEALSSVNHHPEFKGGGIQLEFCMMRIFNIDEPQQNHPRTTTSSENSSLNIEQCSQEEPSDTVHATTAEARSQKKRKYRMISRTPRTHEKRGRKKKVHLVDPSIVGVDYGKGCCMNQCIWKNFTIPDYCWNQKAICSEEWIWNGNEYGERSCV